MRDTPMFHGVCTENWTGIFQVSDSLTLYSVPVVIQILCLVRYQSINFCLSDPLLLFSPKYLHYRKLSI